MKYKQNSQVQCFQGFSLTESMVEARRSQSKIFLSLINWYTIRDKIQTAALSKLILKLYQSSIKVSQLENVYIIKRSGKLLIR